MEETKKEVDFENLTVGKPKNINFLEGNSCYLYQAESRTFRDGKYHEISPVFNSKEKLEQWIENYKAEAPKKSEELRELRKKEKNWDEQMAIYNQIEILEGDIRIVQYNDEHDMKKRKSDLMFHQIFRSDPCCSLK